MGNASSSQQQANAPGSRRTQSPARPPPARAPPPPPPSSSSSAAPPSSAAAAPVPNPPHRSLRHKKKSLELPDLASLALTPSTSGMRTPSGRGVVAPRTSSPIPIPQSANAQVAAERPRALPSQHDLSQLLLQPPAATGTGVRSAHFRGAPLPYNSTRSFTGAQPATRNPVKPTSSLSRPEVIYSSIPITLDAAGGRKRQRAEPVPYKVVWRGLAQSVILARAGHDNWKGRQVMEKDPNKVDYWYTVVHVLPGTHHVKFIVDDQWRVSDDYHKAVADDGSLANYIAIPIPAAGVSSPPRQKVPNSGMSFWSGSGAEDDASVIAYHPSDPRGWTGVVPEELVAAAAEEEAYLAAQEDASQADADYGGGPVAPAIPPAPLLPRFLEKLILNSRPGGGANVAGRDRAAERVRARQREATLDAPHGGMPVTTASGTDISRPTSVRPGALAPLSQANPTSTSPAPGTTPRRPNHIPRLDMPAHIEGAPSSGRSRAHSVAAIMGGDTHSGAVLATADDTSVLPVPSHVILHHLSTSSIRNGVLALANTTRYRKKYITTIYYKPT